jgi:threonine dehydrogenase-like Zn-dependent dehydrogenase
VSTARALVQIGPNQLEITCGQRGLATALVAKAVGAGNVIMTGFARDEHKLAIAREMGVDATIDVEHEDVRERIADLTEGALADVVIDVVPSAPSTVTDAVDLARARGTILIAGVKGDRPVPGLRSDAIVLKSLTIKGARGKRSRCYPVAIEMLAAKRFPFERSAPRSYPLAQTLAAIEDMAGNGSRPSGVCVSIDPTA